MDKNQSLCNDLDFIKEFEELKLKQKLLIETLNSKNKTEMNSFLLEINSKLDFLVKIFKESQEQEQEDTSQDVILNKIEEMNSKIDNLTTSFESKLDLVNEDFIKINKSLSKIDTNVEKELTTNNMKLPKPDFKVDDNLIKTEISNNKKDKKKWF